VQLSGVHGIMSHMLASARCKVCDEMHVVDKYGVMSIHFDVTGARCAGSVGRSQRPRSVPRNNRPTLDDRPKLRLERNHPPYSKQWTACDECGIRVPVTIYGKLADHRVHRPGVPPSKKASKAARRLCAGSGVALPEYDLKFEIAQPPKVRLPEPAPRVPKLQVKCPRCGVTVTVRGEGEPLPAHQRPSRLWCAEGVPPTEYQRAKARAKGRGKRSVWAVSGGLPTLGQGR